MKLFRLTRSDGREFLIQAQDVDEVAAYALELLGAETINEEGSAV
jgi:hypothetical protein